MAVKTKIRQLACFFYTHICQETTLESLAYRARNLVTIIYSRQATELGLKPEDAFMALRLGFFQRALEIDRKKAARFTRTIFAAITLL